MPRTLAPLLLGLALLIAQPVHAQAPHALPAHVTAQIGLPGAGPARFANLTLTLGALPWVIEGCIASSASVCFATHRVELTEPQRRELVVILQLLAQRMRCPPPASDPGDPAFTLTTPADVWQGALPADPARIPARTSGQCAAAGQLAWWLASRFRAGTAPPR